MLSRLDAGQSARTSHDPHTRGPTTRLTRRAGGRGPLDALGTRGEAACKLASVPSPTGLRADGVKRSPTAAAADAPRKSPAFETPAFADDGELVAALRRGDGRARMILVERYEPLVERLVTGALGIDAEIADVIQDVFVAVLEGIRNLKDASALRSWIATLAVFTARGRIRRRRRWRWIRFVAPEDVPEVPVAGPQGETREAVRATYTILAAFPADERIAFSLRFISEMQLTEVASACRVSLATIKRRLTRAESRFVEAARAHPALAERLARGGRWGALAGGEADGMGELE
jgi:RNA polymerase sigma-70 factor, ECF subfamily